MPGATDLLREDHNKVKDLFRRFEDVDDAVERRAIADEAIMELEIHSQIEEEIFYPAVRRQSDASGEMDATMNEADEEHHVVDLLIGELKKMRGANEVFVAKFTVLAENVKHHIGEEEAEIFTKAAENGGDYLRDLGEKMEQRKLQLMASYGKRRAGSKRSGRKMGGTSRMKKGAGASRGRAKKAAGTTKAAAKKTQTRAKKAAGTARVAAKKTQTRAKKTARKASAAAESTARRTGAAARKTARKATRAVKKATRAR